MSSMVKSNDVAKVKQLALIGLKCMHDMAMNHKAVVGRDALTPV